MIRLSASKLNVFKDSPLDFWLSVKRKIDRPRGIMASLPGGMDRIIKQYMDQARPLNARPPELRECEGLMLYQNQPNLNGWRHWNNNLKTDLPELGFQIIGAFDDLLTDSAGKVYTPFDYKTKGKPSDDESTKKYYQVQGDIYALMLEKHRMKTSGKAIFIYFSPKEFMDSGVAGQIQFDAQPITIDTSIDRVMEFLREVKKCLDGPMPEPTGTEYDVYVERKFYALREGKNDNG